MDTETTGCLVNGAGLKHAAADWWRALTLSLEERKLMKDWSRPSSRLQVSNVKGPGEGRSQRGRGFEISNCESELWMMGGV